MLRRGLEELWSLPILKHCPSIRLEESRGKSEKPGRPVNGATSYRLPAELKPTVFS
jgi:hypothetical protein